MYVFIPLTRRYILSLSILLAVSANKRKRAILYSWILNETWLYGGVKVSLQFLTTFACIAFMIRMVMRYHLDTIIRRFYMENRKSYINFTNVVDNRVKIAERRERSMMYILIKETVHDYTFISYFYKINLLSMLPPYKWQFFSESKIYSGHDSFSILINKYLGKLFAINKKSINNNYNVEKKLIKSTWR